MSVPSASSYLGLLGGGRSLGGLGRLLLRHGVGGDLGLKQTETLSDTGGNGSRTEKRTVAGEGGRHAIGPQTSKTD